MSKEHLFLPHTGIDQPFLKKKINFIKDAPDFEPVHCAGNSNYRFLMGMNNSLSHNLTQRPGDFLAKIVYDCCYVGGSTQTVGTGCQPKDKDQMWVGNTINGKYYDKLQNYYNLKGPNDNTLIFESRFESGNLAKAV
jgi:hypothetical protein